MAAATRCENTRCEHISFANVYQETKHPDTLTTTVEIEDGAGEAVCAIIGKGVEIASNRQSANGAWPIIVDAPDDFVILPIFPVVKYAAISFLQALQSTKGSGRGYCVRIRWKCWGGNWFAYTV